MVLLWGLLFLSGIVPLFRAICANRDTTLRQPLLWALLAWAVWTAVAWSHLPRFRLPVGLGHYLAICLTGCAGVAVLGAHRPGVGAWNFVVAGLLAVLLLPVLNGLGELRLETAHRLFLSVTLAVPVLNYLPTRLGPSVVLLAIGCGLEMWQMDGSNRSENVGWGVGEGLVSIAPWAAWASFRLRSASGTEFDRLWLAYRDRYGFVWGQRMREQFNRAASHAGWPVVLRWKGLHAMRAEGLPASDALLATLCAVVTRFGPTEERDRPQSV